MKNIHYGNLMECKTYAFYSPTSTGILDLIHENNIFGENYMKWSELHRYFMSGNLHPMGKGIWPYHKKMNV